MPDKNGKINQLVEGTLVYAVGSFGTKILSFLIVPLYTYYISTSDMGVYDLLNSTISLLSPIVTLQIAEAAYRWMVRHEEHRGKYIKSTVQVLSVSFFVWMMVIWAVSQFYSIPYCLEFALLLVTSQTLASLQKLLRGLQNQKLFAASGVLYTAVYLVLNVVQICALGFGVRSLFTSAIVANIVAVVYVLICEHRLRIRPSVGMEVEEISKMLRFSVPLIPNQLNWWAINSSNRFFISYFLGVSANGIFAVTSKFPSMLQLVLSFFTTSWQDVAIAEKETQQELYSNIFKNLYTVAFSSLWVLVPATKIVIELVMADAYLESAKYVSFLYMGAVFQSFSAFYGVGYLRDKNTTQIFVTSIYGAVINIVFNFIGIRYIGLYASSVSTAVGFLVMWIIRERQNRDSLHIYIEKKSFVCYFMISLFVCLLGGYTNMVLDFLVLLVGGVGFALVNKALITQIIGKIRNGFCNKS